MRLAILALVLLIPACDDSLFGKTTSTSSGEGGGGAEGGGVEGGGEEGGGEEGGGTDDPDWCSVETIFAAQCASCHTGASGSGGLDLTTDPYTAIVDQASVGYAGRTLVVPGDSAGSFLYLKVTGAQSSSEGTAMPPMDGLGAARAAAVAGWIDAGATTDCGGGEGGDTGDTGGAYRYHPEDYASSDVHGPDAKLQVLECIECHGADLTGSGEAASCDSCHTEGWRTTCTYCHGGTESDDGAPPRDIDGETDPDLISYPHHTIHLSDSAYKDAFECSTCHAVPEDVLSEGHLFVGDDTPGVAELDFSAGLSAAAVWDGATCSELYCHGDGQGDNGEIAVGSTIDDCTSCHPHKDSSEAEWMAMSGAHDRHLSHEDDSGLGFECGDCHKDVVDIWEPIVDTSLHVNGEVNIRAVGTITWTATTETCEGECHGERHEDRWWFDL